MGLPKDERKSSSILASIVTQDRSHYDDDFGVEKQVKQISRKLPGTCLVDFCLGVLEVPRPG